MHKQGTGFVHLYYMNVACPLLILHAYLLSFVSGC